MKKSGLFFIHIVFFLVNIPAFSQDLGVIRITSPQSNCTLSATEFVTIVIKNYNSSPYVGNLSVSYKMNASPVVTENPSVAILAGDSTTYTFTTTANLSATGLYSFKAYTSATVDVNRGNDTLFNYVVNHYPPTAGGAVSSNNTVCSGNNNGTLTLTGQTGTVLSWDSSTDGGTNWNAIANTTITKNYLNIAATTMYRASVKSGNCSQVYSSPATVTVLPSPNGGTLSGITTVCEISNSGTVSLSGYSGTIIYWEYSTDGGNTWNIIPNTSTTQSYSNLGTTTMYRSVVQSGSCNSYSSIATITVTPATVGGMVSQGTTVCGGINNGTVTLSGQTGNIVRWEYSTDGGTTWVNISNTTTTQNYSNLTTTTMYRAVIQSGVCPQVNSTSDTIVVTPVSVGGVLNSSASVCTGSNSGNITLNNYVGAVQYWQSSTDGGVTWSTITNTTNSLSYLNLTSTTIYRTIVKSGICSSDTSSSAVITVDPLPVANAGNDTTISLGYSITLNGSGGISYSWVPAAGLSSTTSQHPVASPTVTTTYTLTVTDANGCSGTTTIKISILEDFNFTIMNLITPNGDGKNDVWYIGNIDEYPLCEVSIFTIYDKEIFKASPYKNDWDGTYNGTPLPDGTYYYVMKCPDSEKELKGFITLLRNK